MAIENASDIRHKNRLAVLRYFYVEETVNRRLLAHRSGLSTTTIVNVVSDLINANFLVESGYEGSNGGRPRAILAINRDGGYFVGIDIAETYIHFELFDLGLNCLETVEHHLDADENLPAQMVEHIVQGLNDLLATRGITAEEMHGVGISVPGLVERSGGVSVFAPNWGWHNVPLGEMLRKRIDFPLYLDNPLKAGAVAQQWFGPGKSAANLVVLNIGTGVGAGIVIDGELYRGTTNGAGEWGHTTIDLDGRQCRCGSHGCIEAYVGAPGIIQHLREIDPSSLMLHAGDQMEIVKALATAAAESDIAAREVIRRTARYLGAGIANVINLYNPEVVVIGGWVTNLLGRYLLPELTPIVQQFALSQSAAATRIELDALHHNPVSLGAATFALEAYLASFERNQAFSKS